MRVINNHVEIVTGNIPILLTCPHGGRIIPDKVPIRMKPGSIGGEDYNTALLLDKIIEYCALQDFYPFAVKSHISRTYCDLNRSPEEAYESPSMQSHYEAYHHAIETSIKQMVDCHSEIEPVLFDIHGQNWLVSMIIRGTADGVTCEKLIERYGEAILTGEESIFGELFSRGYEVDPFVGVGLESYPKEMSGFNAGFTSWRYSGKDHQKITMIEPFEEWISCIQIETGSTFREVGFIDQFARDFAASLVAFYSSLMQKTKTKRLQRDSNP
eukprot:TRINITY_DN13614_c0_g1_i1.p1 TRINITY_DN13614_c0_g1~~TRINITY_DN13614_c0_g1_i1.p1  ORF type:complete len:277 (-),score=46.37 TRINITY_DN13614_c0_g1_i1:34-843(-)